MKIGLSISLAAFAAFGLFADRANSAELYTIEYTFTVGKAEATANLLEKIEVKIEKQLCVGPFEDPKAWTEAFCRDKGFPPNTVVQCAKVTKGAKWGTVTYICATTDTVLNTMASTYYDSLNAHSPVNDVSMYATAVLRRCSTLPAQGCRKQTPPEHHHAQPCNLVTSPVPVSGIYCRHEGFYDDPQHGCY